MGPGSEEMKNRGSAEIRRAAARRWAAAPSSGTWQLGFTRYVQVRSGLVSLVHFLALLAKVWVTLGEVYKKALEQCPICISRRDAEEEDSTQWLAGQSKEKRRREKRTEQ